MKFRSLFFLFVCILPQIIFSQTITYSEPESQDSRSVDFEVIGKVSGNFLVYKNLHNRHDVSVYDNAMNLKERVNLEFVPDKTINVDFVTYPDFAYIIYQYQKRSILHCMAAKINGDGKKISEPVELDTTYISFFSDNKIYSAISSEDKQKIMVYKIQKKNEKFNFTTALFNNDLTLVHKSRFEMPYEERKDIYSDFFVDNEGAFVFTKSEKDGSRDLVSKLSFVTKQPLSDNLEINSINLNNHYLDEIKLKIDNVNKRYLLNSFYYNQKRGNIEGLFTLIWDKKTNKPFVQNAAAFSDSLKQQAKVQGSVKMAFNDYFIRNVILKKDGGFILAAEDFNSQSRGNSWNRMDYLSGYPYMSSYDYYSYSPSSYWYYYRPRSFNNVSQTRYYYNNIAVIDVDKDGQLVWNNIIHKDQYDDDNDNMLSYQIMNAGGELHFLFNELERRNQLIADQSITPDGKLIRNPTLKSLDKGYEFMPRYGKQVSAKQMIVPCMYRNYICFAKIDY